MRRRSWAAPSATPKAEWIARVLLASQVTAGMTKPPMRRLHVSRFSPLLVSGLPFFVPPRVQPTTMPSPAPVS